MQAASVCGDKSQPSFRKLGCNLGKASATTARDNMRNIPNSKVEVQRVINSTKSAAKAERHGGAGQREFAKGVESGLSGSKSKQHKIEN